MIIEPHYKLDLPLFKGLVFAMLLRLMLTADMEIIGIDGYR